MATTPYVVTGLSSPKTGKGANYKPKSKKLHFYAVFAVIIATIYESFTVNYAAYFAKTCHASIATNNLQASLRLMYTASMVL